MSHREALSVEMVALRTGLSASTLNGYRLTGGGPPFHKLGRRVTYIAADVDEWMSARRRTRTQRKAPPNLMNAGAPSTTQVR